MFIIDWWNMLSSASQIFYCIAIPSTLILIIQTVLMFMGMGGEAEGFGDGGVDDVGDTLPEDVPDVDLDVGDGVFGEDSVSDLQDMVGLNGLRIFTFRGLIAFFVTFSWIGIVMETAESKLWLTIPIALVCGFGMMVLLAVLLRAVMRLRSDGNTDNRNSVGTAGKVYLTIPPARSGEGKVQVMLQGSYVERNAVTDDAEAIPTGSEIIVVGVSGQTDLVVKRK